MLLEKSLFYYFMVGTYLERYSASRVKTVVRHEAALCTSNTHFFSYSRQTSKHHIEHENCIQIFHSYLFYAYFAILVYILQRLQSVIFIPEVAYTFISVLSIFILVSFIR